MLLVAGASAASLRTLTVEGVTMWIQDKSFRNSEMTMLGNDDYDYEEAEEMSEAQENEAERVESRRDYSYDIQSTKDEIQRTLDAIDAQKGKNAELKGQVWEKLQESRRIAVRTKLPPPFSNPPVDNGVRKYPSADFSERFELENYEHRLEKLKAALEAERAKQTEYEDAVKTADEMIEESKQDIAE